MDITASKILNVYTSTSRRCLIPPMDEKEEISKTYAFGSALTDIHGYETNAVLRTKAEYQKTLFCGTFEGQMTSLLTGYWSSERHRSLCMKCDIPRLCRAA
jgi:hypothetical protein